VPPTSLRSPSNGAARATRRCSPTNEYKRASKPGPVAGHCTDREASAMDELHEADILWPDTAPSSLQPGEALLVPSETSSSSGGATSSLCRSDQGFLSGGAPSTCTAGASSGVDEEEWLEADVLWPDTVRAADEPRLGGWFPRAGRRVRPGPGGGLEGWRPAASSPIDIPAKVAGYCR
jgi:hypothetical protein